MPRPIDATDHAIVRELQADGAQTNVAIAHHLGISEGAVRRRTARLRREGLVRIAAVVDPAAFGLRTHAVIGMHVELHRAEKVATRLATLRELSYVYETSGQYDVIAVGFFASDEELRIFLTRRLAPIEGILRTDTLHVMRTLKRSLRWGDSADPDPERDAVPPSAGRRRARALTAVADPRRRAGRPRRS